MDRSFMLRTRSVVSPPSPRDDHPSRAELLRSLIERPEKAKVIAQELRAFSWDSEKTLVVMHAEDVLRVLAAYQSGSLEAAQITDWAEALEMRDDVKLDPKCEDLLRTVIVQLANPDLGGALSLDRAQTLTKQLAECSQ
jgi:hypothetical protein